MENRDDPNRASDDLVRSVPANRGDRPRRRCTTNSRRNPDVDGAGIRGNGRCGADTGSMMMANRVGFYPLEVGAQHVGATSFSVYNTLPAEQLAYVLENAGTKAAICEEQYGARIRASGAAIEHI